MNNRECLSCKKNYTDANYDICPFCGSASWALVTQDGEFSPEFGKGFSSKGETKSALKKDENVSIEELLSTQNALLTQQIQKTTQNNHATRAVVVILRFFMANLFIFGTWIILGFPKEPVIIVIMCTAWLVAAIFTLIGADKEFSKSE